MNCPLDGTELRMTERQGVEIDYCPKCRGIWLDRGEIDKLLERSAAPTYGTNPEPYAGERDYGDERGYGDRREEYDDERDDDDRRGGSNRRRRGRRSLLGDLFDFG